MVEKNIDKRDDDTEEEKGADKGNNEQEKTAEVGKRAAGRGLKDVYSARLKTFEKMRVKSFAVFDFYLH